jgi:hypothetical protein
VSYVAEESKIDPKHIPEIKALAGRLWEIAHSQAQKHVKLIYDRLKGRGFNRGEFLVELDDKKGIRKLKPEETAQLFWD